MSAALYTSGIRKIFDSTIKGDGLVKSCAAADAGGYRALTFNGIILVRTDNSGWVESPFRITDFEVPANRG